jgi:hypothetical protein
MVENLRIQRHPFKLCQALHKATNESRKSFKEEVGFFTANDLNEISDNASP